MNWDPNVEFQKTEEQEAGKPWDGAKVVTLDETHESHVMPTKPREGFIIEDGQTKKVSMHHVAAPDCFCEPFITLKNENIWIHRK